jgi:succinate dehydrogenase/fumarate reductase flavoprotein subunit
MQQPEKIVCDVLVIGSGASGLAAAVTAAHQGLKVIVAEKASQLGGTSAWSGGWLWIPRNPLAVAEGNIEPPDAPEHYLLDQLHIDKLDDRQRTYLKRGAEMVEFFQRHTAVQFYSGSKMPDMHDAPGAASGGRALCAQPFDGRRLGDWINKLRPPLDIVSLAGMGIEGGTDMTHFFNARRSPRSAWHVGKRLLRHTRDLLLHGRGMQLVNGNALIARLLCSALERNVKLLTDAPVTRLVRIGAGVSGAELTHQGIALEIQALRGVVLACGGFPHDPQRISQLIAHAPTGREHHSAAPQSNSGDGLSMAEQIGAWVTEDLPNAGAWAPVSLVPGKDGKHKAFPHLIDRAKPGFIAVLDDGRRFTNEADCYHDFMNALFAATPTSKAPQAWLICDHKAQRRYGLGWAKPFPFPTAPYVRCGYLHKGATLAELARRCGINEIHLQATVTDFNRHAACGMDPEFNRGASPYNRAQGEPLHRPNPALGTLDHGPFYAVRLLPGSLGTFAGLMTDASARVLNKSDQPIRGLYAVGNDMSSVMGGHYPSGGITLGPGMTFGYLAGLAIAAHSSIDSTAEAPAQQLDS